MQFDCRTVPTYVRAPSASESAMTHPSSDVAFTPAVKAIQARRGSREHYRQGRGERRLAHDHYARSRRLPGRGALVLPGHAPAPKASPTSSTAAARRASCACIDEQTLGFADFKGNRQYITTGNLAENPKAYIFVMDYAQRRRVKLWGRARVVEDDPALLARLWPEGYKARDEQVIVFEVEAWDTNCPQHIPQMFHAEDVGRTIQQFQARIKELEAEVAALKAAPNGGA